MPIKKLNILKILAIASNIQEILSAYDEASEDGKFTDAEIVKLVSEVNETAAIAGIDLPIEELAASLISIGDRLQVILARGGKIAKELQG